MDPIEEFRSLFARAQAVDRTRLPDPTAMSLATVGSDGSPSVRIVLLKGVDERGFVFFTNLNSRKGRELIATPRAALCFYWPALETQIRIEGSVDAVSDAEADAYFASRARESQIGAWASQQSEPLASMDELRARVTAIENLYANQPVPRPPYWTGRRVRPERIEFWHAGEHRLHERRLFERDGDRWTLRRLFP
ncbi:MAG TPA: pyridoxamine 5'-phosphate oxidase [Gemmatimonadaceae bacterium]